MNAICLVIDRLHAGYLGPYGNRWVQTPELDRLAAESVVFDHATIDAPELASLYRSWWHGRHACEPLAALDPRHSLPGRLQTQGIRTALVTDDPEVLDALPPGMRDLIELLVVDAPRPLGPADDARRAHLHHCFDTALTWLETAASPFLLWLHIGSLGQVWDAPRELREHYRAEEDPEFAQSIEVPRLVLPANYDPDELQSIAQAYAAQITLLDEHVGHFVDCIRDSSLAADTLVSLVGARGLPLGEHHRVGCFDEALHNELIHVPWLLRFPDGLGRLTRSAELVQPADGYATLSEWWQLEPVTPKPRVARSLLPVIRDEASNVRDRAVCMNAHGERGIRTARWYLRQFAAPPVDSTAAETHSATGQLFAKPDDRYEVNEVADRCPEIVSGLVQALDGFESYCVQATANEPLSPLCDMVQARHG